MTPFLVADTETFLYDGMDLDPISRVNVKTLEVYKRKGKVTLALALNNKQKGASAHR